MRYPLIISNNHYVLVNDGEKYIIDTGSHVSYGNMNKEVILDKKYEVKRRLCELELGQINKLVGVPVDGLIGNDLLGGHVIALDYSSNVLTFDGTVWATEDIVQIMPHIVKGGWLPSVSIELGERKVKAVLDTGAWVSYASSCILQDFEDYGEVKDYSPTLKEEIITTSHSCDYKIGTIKGNMLVGKANGGLDRLMKQLNTEAIIGPSIFSKCSHFVLDFRKMQLYLQEMS